MIEHLEGDCRQVLPTLPPQSVQCCLTSPPYWALRSYLPDDDPRKRYELGQEATPQEYVQDLVGVFREVWRVLMNNGTLWLNLGDAYCTVPHGPRQQNAADKKNPVRGRHRGQANRQPLPGLKHKDLIGLPWRVALALQADGWFLRSDVVWHKPNVLPESVRDRPTKAHEYLFLLAKRERYYYSADAIREPVTSSGGACFGKQRHDTAGTGAHSRRLKSVAERNHPLGRNKRSVWTVPTRSFHGMHFAVFPPELIRPCILAGCPPGGKVLDPFAGSGTTALVAEQLGRDALLIELNPVYVTMQKERLAARSLLGSQGRRSRPALDASDPAASKQSEAVKQRWLWDDV